MALPAYVSIPTSCQVKTICTLILSFAPMLIWPHSASHSSQASSLPAPSQKSSHLHSSHGGHSNYRPCPSPTATATVQPYSDMDNTHFVPSPFFEHHIRTTDSETQSSPSPSEQPRFDSTFTANSLSSSETGWPSEASGSLVAQLAQNNPTPSSGPDATSLSLRVKIAAGIGIGLGILILIAVVLAILWFRRRQKRNQTRFAAEGLECEPKPSFEENSAKSPVAQAEVISSQNISWVGDGRDTSPETRSLPLIGPRLTALNTTIPGKNDLRSSSASKLITTSISSPGFLGDAHATFKFLDQSAPVAVPPTLAKEARSPVSPEQSPLGYFSNVPPSPEERLPPNTNQQNLSVDLDPSPLATKNSLEFFLPILQQESKDAATTPLTSPSIIPNSPQKRITPAVKRTGERAHLRDHPHPLRSYSSGSRGTLADPPNQNQREPSTDIGNNNTPGSSKFTRGGSTSSRTNNESTSLKANNNNDDDPAVVQNFSRKIGSIRSRQVQVREVTGPPPAAD